MPHVLEGRDVAGLAQTGTGKTAAFLLPLMERILRSKDATTEPTRGFTDWRSNQFVLVLVPTRELAEQVYENAISLAGTSGLRAVSIYGGVSYDKQKQGLRDGVEFIIATPGRLIDLYKEHLVDLKNVRAICFDEADRMFDMGFKDDMKYILQRVPKERQFLVFSATLNLDVLNTAYQFGANPTEVNVSRDQAKAENVEDKIFHTGQSEKPAYLLSLLRKHNPRQTIVFSNFKMNVAKLAQFLSDNGVPAVGISSLLTQAQRNRVMEQFRAENDHNVLIATDVAARGLDIKGVDMVVNYELPDDPENYVHRIGRTGRAGAKGTAFSFVSDRDVDALSRIEDYLKHKVDTAWMEDSELVKEYKPMLSDYSQKRAKPYGARNEKSAERPPRQGASSAPRTTAQREGTGPGPAPVAGSVKAAAPAGESRERKGRGERGRNPERQASRGGAPVAGEARKANAGAVNTQANGKRLEQKNGSRNEKREGTRVATNGSRPQQQARGPVQSRPIPVGARKPNTGLGAKVSGFFKRLFS